MAASFYSVVFAEAKRFPIILIGGFPLRMSSF
jgi:hypothetical protein